MAIQQISETQWHGNPRPVKSILSVVYDDAIDPIQYRYITTAEPLASYSPAAAIVTAGPELVVAGNTTGLWPIGSALNVAILVDGGTDISTSIANGSQLFTGEQMAEQVAGALNTIGAGDILCAADGEQVNISALDGVIALTITIWAVA